MKTKKYILLALSLLLGQSAFAHSKAFTPEFVDTLVMPYLHIQEKLAADDLDHSKAAAGILLTALEKGPMTEDATVANPYYGAMMLRCGSVKKMD